MSSEQQSPIIGDEPNQLGEELLNKVKARAKSQGLTLRFRGFHRPRGEVVYSGSGADGRDPQPLGEEISKLAIARGWQPTIQVGDVVNRWEQIVGPVNAAHCKVVSFDEGKLVIQADSYSWAQQLKKLSTQLVQRIVQEIGDGQVVDLVILEPNTRSFNRGLRSVRGRGVRDTFD